MKQCDIQNELQCAPEGVFDSAKALSSGGPMPRGASLSALSGSSIWACGRTKNHLNLCVYVHICIDLHLIYKATPVCIISSLSALSGSYMWECSNG